MIYVVFGVGFSGTTIVSELLHHSGIRMIDQDEDDYDGGSKYEHLGFQNINRELLGLSDDIVAHLRPGDCPASLSETQKNKMLAIIDQQSSKHEDWGFKDPRTVVTYPLWKDLLPEHRIIVVFRDPSNTWNRQRWKGLRKRYVNAWRAYRLLRQWWEYNNIILLNYKGNNNDNFLLLNYEKLMSTNEEVDRLADFIGRDVNDRRKQNMYRKRGRPDILFRMMRVFVNKWTKYSIDNMWARLMSERELEIKSRKMN